MTFNDYVISLVKSREENGQKSGYVYIQALKATKTKLLNCGVLYDSPRREVAKLCDNNFFLPFGLHCR